LKNEAAAESKDRPPQRPIDVIFPDVSAAYATATKRSAIKPDVAAIVRRVPKPNVHRSLQGSTRRKKGHPITSTIRASHLLPNISKLFQLTAIPANPGRT
jgi:hypothetical protein